VRGLPPIEQIVRGSLMETYKRCGRPNCHCADGPGHGPKRYLSTIARTGERPRLGYVPNAAYAQVAEFLANFRKLQEMLNEICAINAELLRRRGVDGDACAAPRMTELDSSSDRITSMSDRFQNSIHRSSPTFAGQRNNEFVDCHKTEGIGDQRIAAGGRYLCVGGRPVGPFARHRKRAQL